MKRERIKRTIPIFLMTVSIINFSAVNANAEWIQNSSKQWTWMENSQKATGWKAINEKWYYFNNNGIMLTGWIKPGQKWYYLKSSGAMATGWVKDGQAWYYLNKNGDMRTGWVYDGGSWYYLKSSGEMATGWITDSNNKYYLKDSGAMVTGKYTIENVTYNFNSSGALIADETNVNKPNNDKEEQRKAYVVTKSDPLNLREDSVSDAKVIGRIPKGSEIIVISKEINGFYKVVWNNLEGYVSSAWISFEKPDLDEEEKDEDVKDDIEDSDDSNKDDDDNTEDSNDDDDDEDFIVDIRDYAPSPDNKYYYSNDNIFYSAKLSPPFYSNGKPIVGNCTWYAWGRIWEISGKRPIQAGFNGNAYEWWDANKRTGKFEYGSTPRVGALAVWKSSLANSGGCGHVAIVEKIENGKVYISESAWHGALFKYKEIYNVQDLYGYIYIDKPNF